MPCSTKLPDARPFLHRAGSVPPRSWPVSRAVALAALLLVPLSLAVPSLTAPPKVQLRGYVTARVDDSTVAILDDHIRLAKGGRVEDEGGAQKKNGFSELAPGQLIEAEGVWQSKHSFLADHVSVQEGVLEKSVSRTAYLQAEPPDAAQIAVGAEAELEVDGEVLVLGPKTRREWPAPDDLRALKVDVKKDGPAAQAFYGGRQVHYGGVRRADGKIEADFVELHDPAPSDAYNMPHGKIVSAKDPETGIDILEAREGDKVVARMKLFPVREVQEYVSDLGTSLLPAELGTKRALEFRFFVVEDPSANAQSLPDGTVLVNTGLLGSVDNEAELAFVLSHEISHVLQAHFWREAKETRAARVGLTVAGIAGYYYLGDTSLFLAHVGMAAVSNGHERGLEDQADRIGVQTVIERGYDPSQGIQFFRKQIDRTGDRTISKLWSNHDSSVLRGSLLSVMIRSEYPDGHFDGARVTTPAFEAMRDAMGPVKIE